MKVLFYVLSVYNEIVLLMYCIIAHCMVFRAVLVDLQCPLLHFMMLYCWILSTFIKYYLDILFIQGIIHRIIQIIHFIH